MLSTYLHEQEVGISEESLIDNSFLQHPSLKITFSIPNYYYYVVKHRFFISEEYLLYMVSGIRTQKI